MASPVKVINTDIVYRTLSTVPQTVKTSLRKQGHPLSHTTKFKFKKQNNIITARFLSGGISEPTYSKEIESYRYYLETTLQTKVEKEKYEDAQVLKVKKKTGPGYVLVNFFYVVTQIPGREINEGQEYENNMVKKLREAGYTQQTNPEEDDGIDVKVNIDGKTAGIELKQKIGAAFGSGTLVFQNGSWKISANSNSVIKKLFNDHLSDWVNEMWYEKTGEYIPNRTATKADQQILGGGTGYYKEIPSDFISSYYNKSHYIQIKGKGFYKLGNKNPLNISTTKVSKFNPTSAKARIRVKAIGGNKFAYKVELYIGDITQSVNRMGLDGDLSFLQTTS
jgi:hypothetical protein